MRVDSLSKEIDGKLLLDKITFEVNPGEIVGIVGRNGIGKTTLFRTMMGFYIPDEGDVYLDEPISKNPELKQKIFMLQDNLGCWDGYKIPTIKKFYQKTYPLFDGAKFDLLMNQVNLATDVKFQTYSKGMKALFGLVLSLCIGADFILLDEPMEGIDVIAQKKITGILLEEVERRKLGIVISSHRLNDLEPIADYIHILQGNRIEESYHLETLREQAVKIQIAFENKKLPTILLENGKVINKYGRVYTILFRDMNTELYAAIKREKPIFMDELAVTLEDLFVYHLEEQGGEE
ncbi:ATP-binding cassette domain-containing protein [Listeria innocua]|uniref:ATP-binding cassette domain-containing protein n=1 Tax=Listeria innocua TaxID=1642 RepID=UPI0013653045|nr:ABC transporter ATP-binding protein [Listeria innocua]MWW18883.1 ATP-binding cassette domain-containing protein [Listeria monocytogenes]EAF5667668.1 ABC transporter ATP-binding protein [Listeria innocua]EAG9436000.1 ABC transporter ATP-binding protein [Listeria innocua]EIX3331076.1 ABC transporter ATP-binding protein [Listeria innocua]EIX6956398.1 ABC transporter ATP-binding protein [Listeria innocua]